MFHHFLPLMLTPAKPTAGKVIDCDFVEVRHHQIRARYTQEGSILANQIRQPFKRLAPGTLMRRGEQDAVNVEDSRPQNRAHIAV
jgi:hypothetical protein